MRRLRNFEYFIISERLGINQDVEMLTDYLYKIIKNKSLILKGDDIPIKISKPINKIVVDIIYSKKVEGRFNIKNSKLTEKGWDLYLEFKPNPEIELIFHEVQHAFKFIMMGKEKSLEELNRIKASKKTLLDIPIGKRSEKLNNIIDLIYYLDNTEIDSLVAETYANIKELSSKYKIDKPTFINLIRSSYPMRICEFVDELDIHNYLSDISPNTKNLFFSLLKNHQKNLESPKKTLIEKLKIAIRNLLKGVPKLKENEIDSQVSKWEKHFKKQSDKLKMKIWRTWDLIQ